MVFGRTAFSILRGAKAHNGFQHLITHSSRSRIYSPTSASRDWLFADLSHFPQALGIQKDRLLRYVLGSSCANAGFAIGTAKLKTVNRKCFHGVENSDKEEGEVAASEANEGGVKLLASGCPKVHKYFLLPSHQNGGLNPSDLEAEIAKALGSYDLARECLFYSDGNQINGFAATLTEDQVELIKKSLNIISVVEDNPVKLYTTQSWDFLGLEHNGATPPNSLWNLSRYGEDIIIGNIDTGVWPESESFNDEGLGPIPSRWKGVCQRGSDDKFKCNKKLIGARYFNDYFRKSQDHKLPHSFDSPRDTNGHGTHTLSIAGGCFVPGAHVFGFGYGVAKGGSPKARVASYKVVWPAKQNEDDYDYMDIIEAFDAAIADGVDVLSVSMGMCSTDYRYDPIAVGSFKAVQHGIVVVAAAGNSGPRPGSVLNTAPWIFTIGASTMDREFINWVYLGNSKLCFKGVNVGPSVLKKKGYYPLIDSAFASANASTMASAGYCLQDSLDPKKVKGKIVFCRLGGGNSEIGKGWVVKLAGGVGMILANDERHGDFRTAAAHVLPASHISFKDGLAVEAYIRNTKNPSAYITNVETVLGVKPAPVMASFSSRGPNKIQPGILKPDVTAPGVNVIAAYKGPKISPFQMMSGTSMSCPHVAGVCGLLKSIHPDWSPAAIRSAIMTTATNGDIPDSDGHQTTPFAYGAGHINPNAAVNPGLIYDLNDLDYVDFICSTCSYTKEDLKNFFSISQNRTNSRPLNDFNYPSITVANFTTSAIVRRIVTNVGSAGTYKAKVIAPKGVFITVIPSKLEFSGEAREKKSFELSFKANGAKPKKPTYVFGSLVWTDGIHNVRSPIVVHRV